VEKLLSPQVQVQIQEDIKEIDAKLTAAEVARVFTEHVPGVRSFLFREQPGQYVLKFLQVAYKDGWSAFRGTEIHNHLKWLMRLIVHHGHEGRPEAAKYLKEVAEAFMDCQAVQARVVEKVGLQIQGVTTDFRGLVVAMVGEYKTMALKMLAAERLAQRKAYDDATPTHYENRLTADLGQQLGINANDVRRATLDEHASSRFARVRGADADAAILRARELFDIAALLQALVSELNSFTVDSSPESLPQLFLKWADQHIADKHVVLDEETCSRIDVDCNLVMAVLETIFLGRVVGLADSMYRGRDMCTLLETPALNTMVASADSTPFVSTAEWDTHVTGPEDDHLEMIKSNVVSAGTWDTHAIGLQDGNLKMEFNVLCNRTSDMMTPGLQVNSSKMVNGMVIDGFSTVLDWFVSSLCAMLGYGINFNAIWCVKRSNP